MSHTYEYAGFWIRFLASIIDSIILIVALIPIMMIIAPNAASSFTGWTWSDWLGQIIGAVFYIVCWVKFAGTPGKRLLRLKVLDEKTGENLTVGQAILRYIGYFPAMPQKDVKWLDLIHSMYEQAQVSPFFLSSEFVSAELDNPYS